MIARLLSLIGTGLLATAAIYAVIFARDVLAAQPPLPQFAQSAAPDSATAQPQSTPERPRRPDVFYNATTQRPLFAPTRRPYVPEPEPAAAPEPVIAEQPIRRDPPPEVDLLGVMGDASGNRALVSIEGDDPEWVFPDSNVEGWTVSEIGSDWLTISKDTESLRIEMYQ